MRYDVILMDIDNTLLDFNAGTRDSLQPLQQFRRVGHQHRALLQTAGIGRIGLQRIGVDAQFS